MRRIVAYAGLWTGVFGWSESADPSLSVPVCPRPCAGGKANQSSIVLTRGRNCPSNICDHDGLRQPVAARVSSGFLIAVIMGRAFYAHGRWKSSHMSTLHAQHNTWHENDEGAYPSILSMTWIGMAVPVSGACDCALRAVFVRSRHAERGQCTACHRPFATGSSLPYDACPRSAGL